MAALVIAAALLAPALTYAYVSIGANEYPCGAFPTFCADVSYSLTPGATGGSVEYDRGDGTITSWTFEGSWGSETVSNTYQCVEPDTIPYFDQIAKVRHNDTGETETTFIIRQYLFC